MEETSFIGCVKGTCNESMELIKKMKDFNT